MLGGGWNTAVGTDTLQLTKCFSVPGRSTLISWETTFCHMFFVCVRLGNMLKHCLAWMLIQFSCKCNIKVFLKFFG